VRGRCVGGASTPRAMRVGEMLQSERGGGATCCRRKAYKIERPSLGMGSLVVLASCSRACIDGPAQLVPEGGELLMPCQGWC
jgi:hypothetical protein